MGGSSPTSPPTASPLHPQAARSRTFSLIWPPALAALAAAALCLPFILTSDLRGRGAYDQINYHEPALRWFAETFPALNFSNYTSATTPLYHVLLALFCRFISPDAVYLRLAGFIFTIGLIVTVAVAAARRAHAAGSRTPGAIALVCTLPIAASFYVFNSGAWLLPDNTAWWGVTALVLLALRPTFDTLTLLFGGFILVLLVLTRQIHLWTAGLLWAAAVLGSALTESQFAAARARDILDDQPDSAADLLGNHVAERDWPMLFVIPLTVRLLFPSRTLLRTGMAVLATLPAFLAVAYFVNLWGGLIVPRYQHTYHGFNLATPAFFLSLFGLFGLFFADYFSRGLADLWRNHRWLIWATLALALVLALVPATNYDKPAGRSSGIWNLVAALPLIAGRTSPLILALTPLGALILLSFIRLLPVREGWVMLAAVTGFVAAQTASPMLWQRYHEPFILILLALMASRTVPADRGTRPFRGVFLLAGPIALVIFNLALTVREIQTAPVAIVDNPTDQLVSPPPVPRR